MVEAVEQALAAMGALTGLAVLIVMVASEWAARTQPRPVPVRVRR